MKHNRHFIIKYWDIAYNKFGIAEYSSHGHFIDNEFLVKCNSKTFFEEGIPFDLTINKINQEKEV